jgi:hypothetical protein
MHFFPTHFESEEYLYLLPRVHNFLPNGHSTLLFSVS